MQDFANHIWTARVSKIVKKLLTIATIQLFPRVLVTLALVHDSSETFQ